MKKYWKIYWKFRQIQLMKMMEYRSDFWFWLVVSTMWTAFNYFFYGLVIGQSNGVAGWNYDEVMILISFFTMLDALTWSVFYPNMQEYTKAIYDGSLSRLLILPVRSSFIILNQYATYHNLPRFFIGLTVMIITIEKMGIEVGLFQIFVASILFITSSIFLYSGWFILATLSFWVERLKNINEIMPGFRSIYEVPVRVYTGVTSVILTFILPFGLVSTLPSEVILGRANYFQIIYFIIFSALSGFGALKFYNYSIKKYVSVGG